MDVGGGCLLEIREETRCDGATRLPGWTGTWTGCMTVLHVGTGTIWVTGTLQLTVAIQSCGGPYVTAPQAPNWAIAGVAAM